MAKTNAEAGVKEINLAQEIYIHYNKQDYLDYKNKYAPLNLDWNIVSEIYNKDANKLKDRMAAINKLSNKDGETVANALGVLNDVTGNSETMSEMEQKIAIDVADKLRAGKREAITASLALKNAKNVEAEIAILDKYIQYVKDTINAFNQGNKDYMDYIYNKYKGDKKTTTNLNSLFSIAGKLNLLAINQTALTSFDTLTKKLDLLEGASASLKSSKKVNKVQYNGKSVDYQSLIWPMNILFTNILGGLGEGLGATYAIKVLNDYLKTLEDDTLSVNIEGTGTERVEGGSTKKADYNITVNNEDGTIILSFGISAKAQSLKRGKKVTTTFETTKLKNFFDKYIQANNIEKYIFYNNLYQNINGSLEMQYLRKKYAAEAMLGAVTGSNQGENVLFIQYLDQLVSLDEFFESLAHMSYSQLPSLSVQGSSKINKSFISRRGEKLKALIDSEGYKDLTPESKTIVAWVRSRQAIKTLNELYAQVRYTHE